MQNRPRSRVPTVKDLGDTFRRAALSSRTTVVVAVVSTELGRRTGRSPCGRVRVSYTNTTFGRSVGDRGARN